MKYGRTIFLLSELLFAASRAALAAGPDPLAHIRQLDLVHFSHTDYGFTDHPAVCRDMQRRYLDIALDTALATRHLPEAARFHWTAETTVAVGEWWQAAAPARRKQFLQAIRAGQIEVTALPLNATPFLDRNQSQSAFSLADDKRGLGQEVACDGCPSVVGSRIMKDTVEFVVNSGQR